MIMLLLGDVSSDTVSAVPHKKRRLSPFLRDKRHGHYIRQLMDRQDRQLSVNLIQRQHLDLKELSNIMINEL